MSLFFVSVHVFVFMSLFFMSPFTVLIRHNIYSAKWIIIIGKFMYADVLHSFNQRHVKNVIQSLVNHSKRKPTGIAWELFADNLFQQDDCNRWLERKDLSI